MFGAPDTSGDVLRNRSCAETFLAMISNDPPPRESPYGAPRYYAPGYGKRFESARLAAGLSQAEAVRYTGDVIGKSALSLAERERREMRIEKAKRLAGLYGVRVEWLITGAGPRMLDEPDEDAEPTAEDLAPLPATPPLVPPQGHRRRPTRRPKRA